MADPTQQISWSPWATERLLYNTKPGHIIHQKGIVDRHFHWLDDGGNHEHLVNQAFVLLVKLMPAHDNSIDGRVSNLPDIDQLFQLCN